MEAVDLCQVYCHTCLSKFLLTTEFLNPIRYYGKHTSTLLNILNILGAFHGNNSGDS